MVNWGKVRRLVSNKRGPQFVYVKLLWTLLFLTAVTFGIIISPFASTSWSHLFVVSTILLIGIICIVSISVNKQINKAFVSLKSEIDRVASGDFDKEVALERCENFIPLVGSVENMRTRLKERVLLHQEISTLYRISSVVNSILNLEDLLKAAIEEVGLAFKADYGAILLWNDGKRVLEKRPVFSPGSVENVELDGTSEQTEIGGRTFQSGEPVIESENTGSFKSAIGAALIVKERRIGAIELYKRQSNSFSENDLGLLVMVTSQIAMAIENAKLYLRISEDLQKRLDVLGGLH